MCILCTSDLRIYSNPLYFVHDGLEDSILGRPLQCYKSITVDDKEEKEEWQRCKIIIAHQAHKKYKLSQLNEYN